LRGPGRKYRVRTAASAVNAAPAASAAGREQLLFGKNAASGRNRNEPRKGGAGFSFPLPSLMTLAIIAGTVVISLLALHWEGIPLSMSGPETFAPQPGPDEEVQRNLAWYAGIPAVNVPAAGAESAGAEGEEIPLDLMETFEWSSYQVQRGDSVSRIAAKFGISMDAVIASNAISNARRLREGEILKIPNMDGVPYTVKKGDSLAKIASSRGVPLEVILDVNDIRSDAIQQGDVLFLPGARMAPEALKLALGELLFIYPVRSRITSPFGWRISPITGERHYHAALDLAGAAGATVKAAMDGTVSSVGFNPTFGRFIILSHDGGYQSMYAHLSAVSARQGERVSQGNKIGEVGSTGLSTGPHLHFAVYKNGRAINPLDLLN
jgi:murein DD-endopeptidase MepM/ murein hydrolase activator NlpD